MQALQRWSKETGGTLIASAASMSASGLVWKLALVVIDRRVTAADTRDHGPV